MSTLKIQLQEEAKGTEITVSDFRIFGDYAPLFNKEIQLYKLLHNKFIALSEDSELTTKLFADPLIKPIIEEALNEIASLKEEINKEKDDVKKQALTVEMNLKQAGIENTIMSKVLRDPNGIAKIMAYQKEIKTIDIDTAAELQGKIVLQENKLIEVGWAGLNKEPNWPDKISNCLTAKQRFKFIELLILEPENQIDQSFLELIPNTPPLQEKEKAL